MSLTRTVTTSTVLTIAGTPSDIAFKIDIDPAIGYSNGAGLRATSEVMTANGIVDPGLPFFLKDVPLTTSGITQVQFRNALVDLYNFWKSQQGYGP